MPSQSGLNRIFNIGILFLMPGFVWPGLFRYHTSRADSRSADCKIVLQVVNIIRRNKSLTRGLFSKRIGFINTRIQTLMSYSFLILANVIIIAGITVVLPFMSFLSSPHPWAMNVHIMRCISRGTWHCYLWFNILDLINGPSESADEVITFTEYNYIENSHDSTYFYQNM